MSGRKIALCLVDAANDFQQLLKADAEEAVRRVGLGLTVHHTGHDLASQLQQLHGCLDAADKPAAILVLAVRDRGLARVAREAVKAGVSFLWLNRTEDDVEAIRQEAPAGVAAAAVCADERETGRIQGRQFGALLPQGRMVLYVQGSTRSLAARDRTAGMQEATQGAPFEVALLEGGWTAAEAREAVHKWLAIVARGNLRIDLVGCQNDQIALGALRALVETAEEVRKPEIARIPVSGCDGTPALGQSLVKDGRLAATVVLPRSTGRAVELVARLLEKGDVPPPLVTLAPKSFPEESALRPLAGENR
ncbi:MAG: sugar ABC transporter substrate-binding protein [Acidobacteria bacterium]|nr:sugar ABC transporter substrate-binding protein [Acidobacteriota bacterium]